MAARLLGVVAALAVLAAAWFGWSWWSAAHDDSLARGRDRDAVLAAASTELVALNTIDYRTGAADVDRWIDAATGQYGHDLAGDRQLQIDRATSTKTVSTASLVQAAVTELDPAAGTARLIAVLDVRVGTAGAAPVPKQSRLTVDFARVGDAWKVGAVQAVGS
jgi:Mce-associated membrane protein